MPRMRRARAPLVVVLVLALAGFLAPAAEATPEPLHYQPPVEAEVVDSFRPPSHRFGAGNRGIDYATEPDTTVVAAARGVVAFAGQVGGSLHVTVLHPDGVRTTYSFLRSIGVRRGQRLASGQEVGRAGDRLHFGARLGDDYVDPRSLFSGRGRARLVSDHEVSPASEAAERSLIRGLVRNVGGVSGSGVEAAATAAKAHFTALAEGHAQLAEWLATMHEPSVATWLALGADVAAVAADATPCTAPPHPPPRITGRRVLVLVGGLGSSSALAAVDAVDSRALGYADHDVHRFSYRGGTVVERPYSGRDTFGDLRGSGRRLAAVLRRLGRQHPGVPIDVVAHSMGGLVARAALADAPAAAVVRTLVTLGAPHQGADLAATAIEALRRPEPESGHELVRSLRLDEPDGDLAVLRQLVPGSGFLRDLARRPLPLGVQVTSVAASADVVVASSRSRLPGAANVVVTVEGVHDHARLPGSAAARREIALAVAGAPPTCRSPADAALDVVVSHLVRQQQRVLGSALRLGLPMRPAG